MKKTVFAPILIVSLAIVLVLTGCNRPDQQTALASPEPVNPQAQPSLAPVTVQPTLPPAIVPTQAPAAGQPDLNATMAAGVGVTETMPAGEATALPAQPTAESPQVSTLATSTPQPQALATAAPQPTATKSPTGETIHTVQSGERLFSIARLYNVNPYAIAQLNGITAPYLIYPGQKLKIPGGTVSATPVPNQTPVPGGRTYTVQPGDNLFRIAMKFGMSMQAIAAANGLGNYNFIYVGQVLKIP